MPGFYNEIKSNTQIFIVITRKPQNQLLLFVSHFHSFKVYITGQFFLISDLDHYYQMMDLLNIGHCVEVCCQNRCSKSGLLIGFTYFAIAVLVVLLFGKKRRKDIRPFLISNGAEIH